MSTHSLNSVQRHRLFKRRKMRADFQILGRDERAVSDVVGSILMVGITVLVATVMGALLFAFDGPQPTPRVNLATTVNPGNANWGNGDEQIRVQNIGGQQLDAATTTISYKINDGPVIDVTGAALGFPAGRLSIGQTWIRTLNLAANDTVFINVVSKAGGSTLLATATLIPGEVAVGSSCPFDIVPASGSWSQSPADITIATLSAVTLTLSLSDDCAGVDPTVVPRIYWAITPALPSDKGVMTSFGNNQWQATVPIPGGGWALQGLQTLQYYASPLADLRGNSGQTATSGDLIQVAGTPQYLSSQTPIAPTTISSPGNLTAADGQSAVVNEGASVAALVNLPVLATVSSSGWSNPGNGFVSDNNDATTTSSTNPLRYTLTDAPGGLIGTGPTKVVLGIEQAVSSSTSSDDWSLQACWASGYLGGACSAVSGNLQSTSSDTILTYDVSALRPGGGVWTWTDLQNLEIVVKRVATGSRTYQLDQAFVSVGPTYSAVEQLDWTGVPVGLVRYLEIGYSGAALENVNVNVYNWVTSSYTTRGTLTSAGVAQLAYLLTAAEYQVLGGNVRIQLVDDNVADLTGPQSYLIDYARVTTV